jgi:Mg-chelatase subunit ChlD
MASPISVRLSLNRGHLRAHAPATVFAAVELAPVVVTAVAMAPNGMPSVVRAAPPPLNVVLLVDRSGSMAGEKFENASQAALKLTEALSPNDRIGIISFASHARVELPLSLALDERVIQEAIRRISVLGGTNIYEALKLAYEQLQQGARPETLSRVVLLTDGRPTSGKRDVRDFEQLSALLREQGISVTTLGVGEDYNHELLTRIATVGGGLWYHIEDPRTLPAVLREQAAEMTRTVVIHPELELTPLPGAELTSVHSVKPMLTEVPGVRKVDGAWRVPLRDVVMGDDQVLVARIKLPARPPGVFRALRAQVRGAFDEASISYTDDIQLYNKETDAFPRILLTSTEGTVLLRRGIERHDRTAIRQAETMLKTVQTDPAAATVMHNRPVAGEVVTALRTAHEQTAVKKDLSEAEKKQLIAETTIIGRRRSPEGGS